MRPIIIPIENGKISITIAEFKKFMNEAYDQGYYDSTRTTNSSNWWNTIPTVTLDTHNSLSGVSVTSINEAEQRSISVSASNIEGNIEGKINVMN